MTASSQIQDLVLIVHALLDADGCMLDWAMLLGNDRAWRAACQLIPLLT